MSEPINPLVVDLSHYDPAYDYDAVKAAGIVGVIYKATEGQTYQDDTYVQQQHAAKAAGLKWGAYHFATPRPPKPPRPEIVTVKIDAPDGMPVRVFVNDLPYGRQNRR